MILDKREREKGGDIPVPPPVTRMTWSLKRPFSKTELYPAAAVKKKK
jgi:hypothetical protein